MWNLFLALLGFCLFEDNPDNSDNQYMYVFIDV